mgnify:FL=1
MSGTPFSDSIMSAIGGSADSVLLFDNRSIRPLPSLLTLTEVARFLRISLSGVRRLQQQRRIPFIKIGGSVRFAESDILSYVERQRVEPIG